MTNAACFHGQKSNSTFKFKRIVTTQVHNLIMKAVNGKTTGIDLVPNNLLKVTSPVISPHLSEIFNQCIEYGIFPDDLKIGKVVPSRGKGMILGTIAQYQFCQLLQESLRNCFTSNCRNILRTITYWVIDNGDSDQSILPFMHSKNPSITGCLTLIREKLMQ